MAGDPLLAVGPMMTMVAGLVPPPLPYRAQHDCSAGFFLFAARLTAVAVMQLQGLGVVFALNSVVHIYRILDFSQADRVRRDAELYCMSKAAGLTLGTLYSGVSY